MTQKTTPHRIRGTTPEIQQAAQQLRKQATPAETALWQALRNRQLNGLRFRRQHPVGRFILDFYCPSTKLVIELDGAGHENQQDYDTARTQELEAHGYRVLRFDNQQVMNDLGAVLDEIYQVSISSHAS